MATELVKGKSIQEALEVTNKAVMEALDGLPPVKVHCSCLAEEDVYKRQAFTALQRKVKRRWRQQGQR